MFNGLTNTQQTTTKVAPVIRGLSLKNVKKMGVFKNVTDLNISFI